ncbi:MAG: hypothetical protein SH868_13775 [Bythopirellula sp.]|nr:hypothetical protein [Bythopirellula sp.]
MADSDELYWRETYFILFPHKRRPSLKQVSAALANANKRFQLENLAADDAGMIESLMVESPEDHAAVEISYEVGEAIIKQNLAWAKELQKQLPADQLQELMKADARLDVAHFERMPASGGDYAADNFGDEFDDEEAGLEMLDPTCLLTVVETLADLTGGLTFDPAAGEILS